MTVVPAPQWMRRRLGLAVLGLALGLGVVGCAESDPQPAVSAGTGATEEAAAITVLDPWIKAAEAGMTGAFGTLRNDSDAPVTIVAGASAAAARVELHETVQGASGEMVMQAVEGGFEIPAGGERTLAPGGDHIMLMDLTGPVEPGAEITITLTTQDGSTLTITAPARTFAGANETYHAGTETTAPATEAP